MKLILAEKKLQQERLILRELLDRYGNITLLNAHDLVSVELDYMRGDCVKRKSKNLSFKNELSIRNISYGHD